MICRIVQMFLPLYVGNDLPDSIAFRVSCHLGHCDSCMAACQSFRISQSTTREIASRDVPPAPPERITSPTILKLRVAETNQEPGHTSTNRRTEWRSVWSWSVAAIVLIAVIGYLMEHSRENTEGQTAHLNEAEPRTSLTESKPSELRPPSRAEITALMRRLNPRPHLTDEELDAEYPVLVSVDQPDGVPVIYRTNDPTTTIVWVLPRKGANHQ